MARRIPKKEAQAEVKRLGGTFLGPDEPFVSVVRIRLPCQHIWTISVSKLPFFMERGCSICRFREVRQRKTMLRLTGIIESRMGKLLSEIHGTGKQASIRVQCAKGHVWNPKITTLLRKPGTWCWECFVDGLRLTIEDLRAVAAKHGGECLSETYKNSQQKLRWRCARGHIWEAVANNVRHGSWCPVCSDHVPHTIEDMRKIAEKNGGLCKSRSYRNNKTPLSWKCPRGHSFRASALQIMRKGFNCPICAKMKKRR